MRVGLLGIGLVYFFAVAEARAQSGAGSVSHVFRGITIVRLEGHHSESGETHVKYLSPAILKEDDRKRGEKNQWTEDRIKAEEANTDRFSPGGVIQVDILRRTEAAADTRNFLVVITDKEGREIMRKDLPHDTHLAHHNDFYEAMAMCTINRKIEGSFFVVVIDNYEKRQFKFEIIP